MHSLLSQLLLQYEDQGVGILKMSFLSLGIGEILAHLRERHHADHDWVVFYLETEEQREMLGECDSP